jgi:hypothetical protein
MCLKNLFKRKPSCSHNWEETHRYTINVYESAGGKKNEDLPIANRLIIELKCKNCGDIKFQKINL